MNLNFPLTDPFACFIYKLNIPTIISQLTAKLYRLTNFAYIKFVRKRLLERSKFRVRTFEAEVTVILVKTVSVSFVCAADRGCKFRSHRYIDAANERRKWASGASFIPLQKKKKKKQCRGKYSGKYRRITPWKWNESRLVLFQDAGSYSRRKYMVHRGVSLPTTWWSFFKCNDASAMAIITFSST